MCLSLIGDRAPIFTIHFQNQITAHILSYAWHSAASQSRPASTWKLEGQASGGLYKVYSSFSFLWVPWSLISHHPRTSVSPYLLQWQFEECLTVFSNVFLSLGSFLKVESDLETKYFLWLKEPHHLVLAKGLGLWGAQLETTALQQAQVKHEGWSPEFEGRFRSSGRFF